MAEKEKTEKKPEETYSLVELPVETGIFVKDNEKDEVLNDKAVLLEILNKLDKIERAVA